MLLWLYLGDRNIQVVSHMLIAIIIIYVKDSEKTEPKSTIPQVTKPIQDQLPQDPKRIELLTPLT
jgi:hypothetical protein